MRIAWTLLLIGICGCLGPGLLTDGTSVSIGTHSRGALRHAAKLPLSGKGYIVPDRWRRRSRNFGTDELVALVARTARRVNRQFPHATLGVADLSPLGGGKTPEHHSHRSGRDVDLIYYATDMRGRAITPQRMISFDATGVSIPLQASRLPVETTELGASVLHFDRRRNWALIRSLVTDPVVPVQWIFAGRAIRRQLLDYARRKNEPRALIERAAIVMHQPRDAGSHADHIHVRVFCAQNDRQFGCTDRGPKRWLKKSIKYVDVPPPRSALPKTLLRVLIGKGRFLLL